MLSSDEQGRWVAAKFVRSLICLGGSTVIQYGYFSNGEYLYWKYINSFVHWLYLILAWIARHLVERHDIVRVLSTCFGHFKAYDNAKHVDVFAYLGPYV